MTNPHRFARVAIVTVSAFIVLAMPFARQAAAQDRPAAAFEFTGGWLGFADDGIVSEGLVGASARMHVLPRISVGPEIGYVSGQNHSHLMLTGNVVFDLLSPAPRRAVTPFLVVGGGLFQTRERLFTGNFTSTEGAFTAGGGVKAAAGDRMTIGVETRIGWELHIRVSGFVGLQLWR